ncbi:MAG: hypothetical protein ACI9DF_001237 [Verrucomicrobiales bacterium]
MNKLNGRQFEIVRPSNRVERGEQILSGILLQDLQIVLGRIDASFRAHYKVPPWTKTFAMEIEFKITAEEAISIKQARPWVF